MSHYSTKPQPSANKENYPPQIKKTVNGKVSANLQRLRLNNIVNVQLVSTRYSSFNNEVPAEPRRRVRSSYEPAASNLQGNVAAPAPRSNYLGVANHARPRASSYNGSSGFQCEPISPIEANSSISTVFSPIKQHHKYHDLIRENCMAKRQPKVRRVAKKRQEEANVACDIYNLEYLETMYAICKNKEISLVLAPNYFQKFNPHVNARAAIVNWLVQAQNLLHFSESDYYMAIRIFDRTLASVAVPLTKYQLLMVASLWISDKFNNTKPLTLAKLMQLCGGKYFEDQLVKMEMRVLKIINYQVTNIEPTFFVNYYLFRLKEHQNPMVMNGAHFILVSLTLLPEFSSTEISIISAAAVNFALCKVYNNRSNYFSQILNVVEQQRMFQMFKMISFTLYRMNKSDNRYNAALVKYNSEEKLRVAHIFYL